MKQFTQTIGSPSSVLSLINRLENLSEIDHILKRKSLLEEAAIWEKSAELFLHRLQETYPMYRDITVPFALGISKVYSKDLIKLCIMNCFRRSYTGQRCSARRQRKR